MATIVYTSNPETGFTVMMALSMFGAMMTWMLIFITRLFFRRSHRRTATPLKYRLPFYPAGSVAGALLMAALLVTTLFTEQFSMTILFGVPFALAVSALYFLMR